MSVSYILPTDNKYIPAEPFRPDKHEQLKKFYFMFALTVKSIIFGCFVFLKCFISLFVPTVKKSIENKVALVTGGADGIGRACAIELAKQGCNVAIADICAERAEKTRKELCDLGVKAYAYQVDVSISDDIAKLRTRIKEDLGLVNILINNAAALSILSLHEGSAAEVQRVFDVSLLGHIWTIRTFMPDIVSQGDGNIVAICSALGFVPSGRTICYSTTKYAIRGLMESLYDFVHMDKLDVNLTTVCPLIVNTRKDFLDYCRKFGVLSDFLGLYLLTPEEVATATVNAIQTNQQYVSFPSYFVKLLKFICLLPQELRQYIVDSLKPYISPEANKSPIDILSDGE